MKFSIIIFCLIKFTPLVAQSNLSISGITNVFKDGLSISLSSKYLYRSILSYPKIEDSTIIKHGKFNLFVKCESAEFYVLSIKKKNEQEITSKIFLQPSYAYILLNDSTFKDIGIYNNKASDDYNLFNKQLKKIPVPSVLKKLWKEYDSASKTDSKLSEILFNKIDSIEKVISKRMASASLQWVKNNPTSFLNTYVVYDYLKSQTNESTLKKIC